MDGGQNPRKSGPGTGSAIVVASGLYSLWRETLRRHRPAVPAPERGSPAFE
jgi:hypothetical protein